MRDLRETSSLDFTFFTLLSLNEHSHSSSCRETRGLRLLVAGHPVAAAAVVDIVVPAPDSSCTRTIVLLAVTVVDDMPCP